MPKRENEINTFGKLSHRRKESHGKKLRNVYELLAKKPHGKRPVDRHRHRRESDMKWILGKCTVKCELK
jgi:uncharacterized protein (DUF927 family)